MDGPATASSTLDPWDRRQHVRVWNDAVLRCSQAARASSHQALAEIAKLVRMLQRDIPEA